MNYYSISHLIGCNNAVELVTSLTGKSLEWLMMNRDKELSPEIALAAEKIASGTPLQYITGKTHFYDDRYFVTSDVLIPQPDTEHIVEYALRYAGPGKLLLDLCTGSGCIAISILKRSLMKATAVDISAPALEVARKNAELHKVLGRLTISQLNVMTEDLTKLFASADIITANPPYINTGILPTLPPDVQCEPRIALDGGDDGMDFYRRFLSFSGALRPNAVMIFEIGYDQADRVRELAAGYSLNVDIKRDFGGNDRVAIIKK